MSGTIVVIHFETVLMLESQQSPPCQGHTIRSLDNALEAINGPTASCRVCSVYSGIPTVKKMNSEGHYLVVISVANYSDGHYNLPQISLPGSGLHYSFFTVQNTNPCSN